jgi:hypothetical protein
MCVVVVADNALLTAGKYMLLYITVGDDVYTHTPYPINIP